MKREGGVEHPNDPDRPEEIWRRARKEYKPLREGELNAAEVRIPGETTVAFEARRENLIIAKAMWLAMDVLEGNNTLPTLRAVADFLGIHRHLAESIARQNFSFYKKGVAAMLRLQRSELAHAFLQILDRKEKMTYANLARACGRSVVHIRGRVNALPEFKELFNTISRLENQKEL